MAGAMPATFAPAGLTATFHPTVTQGHVLCCLCGTSIPSNPSNMCVNCIRSQVDIAEGVQKQVTILYCRDCGRYLQPPKHWVRADPESKELLTFCVKRIKGLSKVKLVDAGFIWTEPHSKRLKVKLSVQAEVFNGAILQQTFVVDFTVENNMCLDCNRHNANPNSWVACAQVRQHVFHKRTFFYLEQLILKHNADANCINIKAILEGIDFYFGSRAHAIKLIDFLQSVVPIRFRHDKQLVSHDEHTSTYNYKYTFSVEIIPLCKDDLVCLPTKVSSSLGGIGPITLITRITNQLVLIDPVTLRHANLDGTVYWRQPFKALASGRNLTEYMVLDVEPLGTADNKWSLAEVQVARMSDFGRNDQVYFSKTHLGNILHPGDTALGYDLASANLVGLDYEAYVARGGVVPDVILVRKSFEEKRKKRREKGHQRAWKLKTLGMEAEELVGHGRGNRNNGEDATAGERERFLQELEEDPEMRARINLYRDQAVQGGAPGGATASAAPAAPRGMVEGDDDDSDGDVPEVPLGELLDDLEALRLQEEGEDDDGAAEDEMMDDA